MAKKASTHQLDESLTVALADIPVGDVQLGEVSGSVLDYFFSGGAVADGRFCIQTCDRTDAEQVLIDAAIVAATDVISLEVTLKDAAGATVRTAGINVSPDNIAGSIVFPKDETEYELVEVVVTDPIGIASLVVGWVPDC